MNFSYLLLFCLGLLLCAVPEAVMAATTYRVNFINNSKRSWNFAVYQNPTEEPGMVGTIFQLNKLSSKAHGTVSWPLNYGAGVVSFTDDGDSVSTINNQKFIDNVQLGTSFDIINNDGFTDMVPGNNDPNKSGFVNIWNKYGVNKIPALSINGNPVAVYLGPDNTGLNTNSVAQFKVHPTYYIACFTNVVKTQMVDYNAAIAAQKISFEDGATTVTYTLNELPAGGLETTVVYS